MLFRSDGVVVDLSYPLTRDASVRILTPEGDEALELVRHSAAHLLAAAVTNLFPGTQCGIGPATDEGFFYDFVVPRPFVPEDLDGVWLALTATGDLGVDTAVAAAATERQIWVVCADDPTASTATIPSVIHRGDLLVTVKIGRAHV